jgi:hypothetical protein
MHSVYGTRAEARQALKRRFALDAKILPHIDMPGGDVAVPRKEEAQALGVSEAFLRRHGAPTLRIGPVAYVLRGATRQLLLDAMMKASKPKRRR